MKRILFFLTLLLLTLQFAFAGYVTPVAGKACYDYVYGNVYQTVVSGTTYDYDINYSGQYSELSCSNKTALGPVGSCTLRSMGVNYPRGRLFTITQYLPCPIDDEHWILIIPLVCCSFFYLRKKF
jgi:hypothetical protein